MTAPPPVDSCSTRGPVLGTLTFRGDRGRRATTVRAGTGPGAMDGRATWTELTSLCTQHSLRRALDQGRIRHVGRGLDALPDLAADRRAAAGTDGVLSHLS